MARLPFRFGLAVFSRFIFIEVFASISILLPSAAPQSDGAEPKQTKRTLPKMNINTKVIQPWPRHPACLHACIIDLIDCINNEMHQVFNRKAEHTLSLKHIHSSRTLFMFWFFNKVIILLFHMVLDIDTFPYYLLYSH